MADNQSDTIFQEVDDELRKERLTALWKNFGKYIIGTAVGIVLLVAGREAYKAWVASEQERNAEVFAAALADAESGAGDPAAIWAKASGDLSDGYGVLAELKEASGWLQLGDWEAAVTAYDKLAARKDIDRAYRDLAQLLAAMVLLDESRDVDSALSRLTLIVHEDSPWHYSAREQLGYAHMTLGDYVAARDVFDNLLGDPGLPPTTGARIKDLRNLAALKAGNAPAAEDQE